MKLMTCLFVVLLCCTTAASAGDLIFSAGIGTATATDEEGQRSYLAAAYSDTDTTGAGWALGLRVEGADAPAGGALVANAYEGFFALSLTPSTYFRIGAGITDEKLLRITPTLGKILWNTEGNKLGLVTEVLASTMAQHEVQVLAGMIYRFPL